MWLYVPETSSPYAQASEGLNSEYTSPSNIGERLAEASVMWRSKPAQPAVWSRRWTRVGWIKRLSGLTCKHSTLTHGVDLWISSLRAIRAKTTALPEKAQAQTDNASSLPKSFASPRSAGLLLSSEKTYRGTRTDKLKPSFRHWKDWATALRQEYSRRPKPAIPCGASDCSSWPSARTSDTNGAGMHGEGGMDLRTAADQWSAPVASDTSDRTVKYTQGGTPLLMQAGNWHTPRANDAEKRGEIAEDPRNGLVSQSEHWMAPNVPNGGRSTDHAEMIGSTMYHGGKKVQMGLESQAKQWATPTANNPKGSSEGSSEGSIVRADGKVRDDSLHYQAEQFFNPQPSSPGQPIAAGAMSSTDGQNTNQPSVKRKLNPIFVEALMRWPSGLSGFERPETAWTRWWQLMPSYLSALVSQKPDDQISIFDLTPPPDGE